MNSIENSNPMGIELPETPETEVSKSKRYLRIAGWVFFGIFSLLLFTLFKLPDDRLKSTIENTIASFLADRDITFSAGESKLSFFLGVTYTMKDVTLIFPPPAPRAHIDKIEVSPSLLPLLLSKFNGSATITNGDGSITSSFSVKRSNISVAFKSKKLDLGKLGVFPILANFQGSAFLEGSGSVSGDVSVPSTLEGSVTLNLRQIVIDSQSIMGFSIPRINVSEGAVDVNLEKAKATIKTFKLGKAGDDIQGTILGDLSLGKQWETSNLNIKAKFSLSETIMKSFILLDAILGAGKQADGSYAFSLTGPVMSPMPTPISQGNF